MLVEQGEFVDGFAWLQHAAPSGCGLGLTRDGGAGRDGVLRAIQNALSREAR